MTSLTLRMPVQPINPPHPKTVLLSGHAVRADLEAAPVGIYDDIREDVRKLSTVKPIDRIFMERWQTGYRGVLFSHDKPYLFVMDGAGFHARPHKDDATPYCTQLEEREQALTAKREAARAEEAQAQFNDGLKHADPELAQSAAYGAQAPEAGPWALVEQHGPMNDFIERVPGGLKQIRLHVKHPKAEAAGGIIINAAGHVLIVKPTGGHGGYDWTFPKGYLNRNERGAPMGEKMCVIREVEEETGYRAVPVKDLGVVHHNDGGSCRYYVMELVDEGASRDTDGEIEEKKWCTFSEAMTLLNEEKDIKVLALANQQVTRPLVFKSTFIQDIVKGAHSGTMVALYLPRSVADQVAVKDGEKPADLHVTLAYLKGLDDVEKEALAGVVRMLATTLPPVQAKLAGIGRFSASATSDGKDVCYISVDSPAITRFHSALTQTLKTIGISASEVHGYTPHLTLKYIDHDAEMPLKRIEPIDVTFGHLVLATGDKQIHYPLRSPSVVLKKAQKPYGHVEYTRQNKKSGKLSHIKAKGVKPTEAPKQEAETPEERLKRIREGRSGKMAVRIGEKRAAFTHHNKMGLSFMRNKSNHDEKDWTTRAGVKRHHMIRESEGLTEGEAHHFFTALFNSTHKTMDAFIKDKVADVWDDEGGKNPFTMDNGRDYMLKIVAYLERDGGLANGARDLILKREVTNWKLFYKHVQKINTSAVAQKYVREAVRTILQNYEVTSVDTAEARAEVNRIHVDGHLGRSFAAAAYHDWTGRVALQIEIYEGLISFAKKMAEGRSGQVKYNETHAFRCLLHEEFHGCSKFRPACYERGGAVIEEVVTEVAARHVMRDKFGHLKVGLETLRDMTAYNVAHASSYGDYIEQVRDVVARALIYAGTVSGVYAPSVNSMIDAQISANKIVDEVSLKMKKANVRMAQTPRDHVGNFVSLIDEKYLSGTHKLKLIDSLEALVHKKIL